MVGDASVSALPLSVDVYRGATTVIEVAWLPEVPRAMAEAFRSGNMGIMDYYRMKNVMADTDMRDSISRLEDDDKGPKPGE